MGAPYIYDISHLRVKMSQLSATMVSTGKHKTLDVTAKLETIKACVTARA